MMKNEPTPLYIFGAAGYAVEAAQLAMRTGLYRVAAFIDRDGTACGEIEINDATRVPVIGETAFEEMACCNGSRPACAIAIADGAVSAKIAGRFGGLCDFPNIVDPTAQLNDIAGMGCGNLVFQHVIVSWRVAMGSFNKMLAGVTIGHESQIGDHNEINFKASVSGRCTIGHRNLLGTGSMIYQGRSMGDDNKIGMGAVVLGDVGSSQTWVGIPAKNVSHG